MNVIGYGLDTMGDSILGVVMVGRDVEIYLKGSIIFIGNIVISQRLDQAINFIIVEHSCPRDVVSLSGRGRVDRFGVVLADGDSTKIGLNLNLVGCVVL